MMIPRGPCYLMFKMMVTANNFQSNKRKPTRDATFLSYLADSGSAVAESATSTSDWKFPSLPPATILSSSIRFNAMESTHFCTGFVSNGLSKRTRTCNALNKSTSTYSSFRRGEGCDFVAVSDGRPLLNIEGVVGGHRLSANNTSLCSPLITHRRRPRFPVVGNQLNSDFGLVSADVDGSLASEQGHLLTNSDEGTVQLPATPINQPPCTDVKRELLMLSLPALAGQAIDPLAQLMETAYIGRLGTMELASAGVSISIFNIVSKLFNIPLLSVATSFVAEDLAKNADQDSPSGNAGVESSGNGKPLAVIPQRKQLPSVSTALLLALWIGIFEALALFMGSGAFLHLMGVSKKNPIHIPARQYLSLRALGAPAVVLSLALQGVFRGFKDTRTPVICLGIGNLSAVILFPLLIHYFKLGVTGAAISTVLSQYIVTLLMIWCLNKRAVLLPPKMGVLQFGGYIKSGGFLIGRTLSVLLTITLGTSMAARQGPVAMAAHQICMQVWLAVSLLTDALATSVQALIASSVSRRDYKIVKEITHFALRIGLLAGFCLSAILGAFFRPLATFFTNDAEVLHVVGMGVLFVSASQPFNALAYIFDGLHYGVSDFPYAACSMQYACRC
ncbi:protein DETOXIFICATION 45, chloroplastic isoform X2 [Prosopis cineraria]|uniref:protein DETOXIFICATION 45, chloroplastic isoform X2 n=1 Tax=Prosopis cineraria TaxID=364024 RepID=UPI002410089F|nr:protein DETOXIFICATION 45, chloroplastic isoform X2 [Prosopis cineraria]